MGSLLEQGCFFRINIVTGWNLVIRLLVPGREIRGKDGDKFQINLDKFRIHFSNQNLTVRD